MPVANAGNYLAPLIGVVLLACGGDSTGEAGSEIPVENVTGTWTITLGDSIPCSDSLPGRDLTVTFSGSEEDVEPAGSLTFAETWSYSGGVSGVLYGTVNVQSRLVILHLTRQDSLDYGMEIRGTLDDNLVLRGLAFDPYPGYEPLLVTAECTFDAQGARVSP
jgi:hypothetical protein